MQILIFSTLAVIVILALVVLFKMYFNTYYNLIYFKIKKHEADLKWKTSGKQHFILPMDNDKLYVVSSDGLKAYNRLARKKGLKQYQKHEALEIAYYCTPKGKLNR